MKLEPNIALAASAIPISRGERLRVLVYKTGNTATVYIRAITVDLAGNLVPNVEAIDPNGDDLQTLFLMPLTDGYLVSVDAYTTDELDLVGRIFVDVQLQYGDNSNPTNRFPLVSGYVGQLGAIRWPIDRPHNVNEGNFEMQSISIPDVGVGNNINWTDEIYFSGRILAGTMTVIASAAVANRVGVFMFRTNGTSLIRVVSRTTITASQQKLIQFWRGPNLPADTGNYIYIPIPEYELSTEYGLEVEFDAWEPGDEMLTARLRVQRHFTII